MTQYGNHDIGDDRLAGLLLRSEAPELLSSIVTLSRGLFGWFSRRATRADEYVWIIQKTGNSAGKAIADIGAGVSPLPVYLAKTHHIITVDNCTEKRIMGRQAARNWNGWGFLDYGDISPGIQSINQEASSANITAKSLDCVYSVSVIEHLHSRARRILWEAMWGWMKPDADLLLTMDLVPNTSLLWNADQGNQVEDPANHGDCATVVEELRKVGFSLMDLTIRRDYPDIPPTDVAFLHMKKTWHDPSVGGSND